MIIILSFLFAGILFGYGESSDASYAVGLAANCSCAVVAGKCEAGAGCCCDPDCEGVAGGGTALNTSQLRCAEAGDQPGLCSSGGHPLLCVQLSNTAYLGHYHAPATQVDSLHAYEQLAPVRGRAGAVYREREVRPSLGNLTGRYRAGLPVMALYDRSEAVRGSLALPAPTLAGGCVPAPVAFLRPRSAVCRRALSPAVCAAAKNSALDHQMYLMSSAAIAQEPHFPQVMAENNALRTAATETTYYAAHNPELYFSAPGPSPAPARGATDLGAVQARVAGGGAGEQLFLSGHTRLGAVQSVAHLEPASLACTNLVLEARYELVWAGPRILQVRAAVLLGNISLAQQQNVSIRQHFKAVFTHSPPEGGAARQPRPRSGNPGYSAAAPLVFASRLGEGEAGPRFRLEPGGLRVWGDNGPSSLCADNAPAGPRFGLSTVSGCAVRLARPQLQRCAELRASVREIQRGLVRAEYVARLGNLDTTDPGNFVPVLQEEEEEEGDSESGPGCVVQAGLRITVLTVAVPAEDGRAEPIQKINGLKVVPVYEKWLWRCKSKIKGSRKCDGFRDFMLWTEVEFLEIPNMWHHQNTSRFWLKQDALLCGGDVCWADLLAPLRLDTGAELAEAAQWSLALLATLPPTLYFSRLQL